MVIPTEPERRRQKTNVEPLVTSGDHRPIINQQLTKPTILKQNKEENVSESLQSLEFRAINQSFVRFLPWFLPCFKSPVISNHRGHVR